LRLKEPKNIGIALSGGGIRAMVFHMGLFKWLAEQNLFEQVKKVSTVSGASLCVGMIYAHNNLAWPTSEDFLSKILPSVEESLKVDLQSSAIFSLIASPWNWNRKANVISSVLERKWGVYGNLQQLSGDVMWYVNCTTFESGKRFRFCKRDMGDYFLGYVKKPCIPISEIMAASAGFPILIGPYALDTGNYTWEPPYFANESWQPPGKQTVHLWDGGVYDNFGLESIYKQKDGRPSDGLDFLIVSNASSPLGWQNRHKIRHDKNLRRVLEIAMDQVSSVRTQNVMNFLERTGQGIFIKIGNSADYIAKMSKCSHGLHSLLVSQCVSAEQALRARDYPTELKRPKESDFQLLLRHGYEVTDCTYRCYNEI